MQLFDTVLITAASEPQAGAFRRLIARRKDHGLYPRELSFEVVADPPGGRVGTGGGTLWALARLLERRRPADPAAFLETERILLVHAGGESRRLPTYAPEGKLFAPLPLPSSALLPPVARAGGCRSTRPRASSSHPSRCPPVRCCPRSCSTPSSASSSSTPGAGAKRS